MSWFKSSKKNESALSKLSNKVFEKSVLCAEALKPDLEEKCGKDSKEVQSKYLPLVFTEQGIAMLSGILKSEKAVKVNISIMRTFIKIRQLLLQESLSERVVNLEKGTDKLFRVVFQRLDDLEVNAPILSTKRRKIGIQLD